MYVCPNKLLSLSLLSLSLSSSLLNTYYLIFQTLFLLVHLQHVEVTV